MWLKLDVKLGMYVYGSMFNQKAEIVVMRSGIEKFSVEFDGGKQFDKQPSGHGPTDQYLDVFHTTRAVQKVLWLRYSQ